MREVKTLMHNYTKKKVTVIIHQTRMYITIKISFV